MLCGVAAACLAPAAAASAQTQDLIKVPAQAEAPAPAAPPVGVTAGPFTLDGSFTAREVFSDNIFVTKNNMLSDWITVLSPNLSASLGDSATGVTVRAGAELGRYARYATENYNDHYAGADGRLRLGDATTLFGGAQYDWSHESRESPDALNGTEPTRYGAGDFYVGVLRSFPKFVVRGGATVNTYAFADVPSSAGPIDAGDRNRNEYQAGVRVSYRLTSALQPFVQGYWDARNYKRPLDDLGYARSSSGYRAAAGLSGDLATGLRGEVYAGLIGQSYDDPRFGDLRVPDFGARLTWRPVAGSSLSGFVDRSVEETTLAGSAGYLRTAVGGSIEQEVRPDLYLDGHLYYSRNAYLDVARTDHVSDVGMGVKYFFTPRLFVGGGYAMLHRTSTTAEADFWESRLTFRLGAQLGRAYPEASPAFAAPTFSLPGGLYVALLGGRGATVSAVDGPRGPASGGGSLVADFGHDGWQGDLGVGYGGLIGHTYLGVEALAALASEQWLHTGTGGTRTFSSRELQNFEVAARLGYQLANNAIVYGRFGAVAAKFGSDYVMPEGSTDLRVDGYRRGLRVGAGLDFPISGRLAGRMEYVVTSYQDYDMPWGRGADNFATNEGLTRFGLVYRFSGPREAPPATAFDYGGPYVGLQGGFGTLISGNAGPRNPPQTLDAERAGSGATVGLFAGYGGVFHRFYIGGEFEGELSDADWNIKRDPQGRIYSVSKDATLGVSALAGYVLPGSTLAYVRAGAVETRFHTRYRDEGGANLVDPVVNRPGLRLGGGVATPIGRRTVIRFDYTWTDYRGYDVGYVTGTDSFRNSEDLFRVGIARRF